MRADYANARQRAFDLLESQGIAEPPVNPAEIARSLGIDVFFVTFKDKEIASHVSGFYDADDDAIYVNEEEYPLRQTFTIAHELAHRMLHRDWASSNNYKMLMRSEASENDAREKEANMFAAHLLVPRHMLDRYYQLASPEGLSTLFAVSVPVIKNRLNQEYGI